LAFYLLGQTQKKFMIETSQSDEIDILQGPAHDVRTAMEEFDPDKFRPEYLNGIADLVYQVRHSRADLNEDLPETYSKILERLTKMGGLVNSNLLVGIISSNPEMFNKLWHKIPWDKIPDQYKSP
jgi:hypothetical protein